MYEIQVAQFKKMLKALDNCMVKAAAHADAKKFDVNQFCDCRLIADMFSFTKQVQATCDAAKFFAARLSGKEAPKHEDNEKTWAELRERIKKVVTYLDGFSAKDFAKSKDIKISPNWAEGKWLTGDDFANELSVPNFYFHMNMAYAILRANGVDLGKQDYLGGLNLRA
jgi:uncharacterized protein